MPLKRNAFHYKIACQNVSGFMRPRLQVERLCKRGRTRIPFSALVAPSLRSVSSITPHRLSLPELSITFCHTNRSIRAVQTAIQTPSHSITPGSLHHRPLEHQTAVSSNSLRQSKQQPHTITPGFPLCAVWLYYGDTEREIVERK